MTEAQMRVWLDAGLTDREIAERRQALALAGKGHPGNADCYDVENVSRRDSGTLVGKTVVFLGSSVTYGAFSCGQSFADFLAARDGVVALKEAVSGTTLVNDAHDGSSYVERLMRVDASSTVDALVCQLSTNDALAGKPIGSAGRHPRDTATIAGAIEYIVDYARAIWDCPVLFYVAAWRENDAYARAAKMLKRIADDRGASVIDFSAPSEVLSLSDEERALYLYDSVHPTKAGYLLWWLPRFEEALERLMAPADKRLILSETENRQVG